jgi:hypothetical protein
LYLVTNHGYSDTVTPERASHCHGIFAMTYTTAGFWGIYIYAYLDVMLINLIDAFIHSDRLCGLVVRGPGFDPGATRFSEN